MTPPKSLLGDWVSVVVKFSDNPVRLHFEVDGQMTMTEVGGETHRLYFKCVDAKERWTENLKEMAKDPKLKDLFREQAFPEGTLLVQCGLDKAAAEVGGGATFIFDARQQTLSDPLTAFFCREADAAKWKQALEADRPKQPTSPAPTKNASSVFKPLWQISLPSNAKFEASLALVPSKDGGVLVAPHGEHAVVISTSGKLIRKIPIAKTFLISLRQASGAYALAGIDALGDEVAAYDLTGRRLWRYTLPDVRGGIHDICSVTLGPGKPDAVAVAFTGGGGLSLLSDSGHLLWHRAIDANAWSVAQLKRAAKASLIVISDADGDRLLTSTGQRLRMITPHFSLSTFAGLDVDGSGSDALISLGITEKSTISATRANGKLLWSHPSPLAFRVLRPALQTGRLNGRRILATADFGGVVALLDPQGNTLTRWVNPEKQALGFTVFNAPDGSLRLAMLTRSGVTCYLVHNLP